MKRSVGGRVTEILPEATDKRLGLPEFRVLGPLRAIGPGGPARVAPGRQETLLAALLLEANRVVSTDLMIDLMWDEEPPSTARTQVQICVSRIRKALAAVGIGARIVSQAPGYELQTEPDSVDITVFRKWVAQARSLSGLGELTSAAELLSRADALWQGPCLSGVQSDRLRNQAQQLDEERLATLETHLQLELELGRHHDAIGRMRRLVYENPLRETLRGLLMVALYRSGRQAEALDTYRAARELMIEELGLEPGEGLRRLESKILADDPGLRDPSGSAAVPNRESVITGGQGPAAGPEPEPEQAVTHRVEVPRQLPAGTGDFVGRDELLRNITDVLVGDASQKVVGIAVITGKPGVGKSTLATQVGHRLSDEHFPDGQLYCDLRGSATTAVSTTEVMERFLRALGIPGPLIPESLDERAEMYRSIVASRRMLVILDDAAGEAQVRALLPGSRSCAVMVTSRARLTGLPGAHLVDVGILGRDHALELLGHVVGTDRVAAEPEAAEALIRTVGGLPLALRIVAARLAARPHWTLASMVHRLASERHRLDELTHGDMAIRASLTLTYDGLGPDEQRLLRLLGLAQGPTLPGWLAGALLQDDRPFPSDLLEPLVDIQMLDVVSVSESGAFQYGLHEIIRVFARERLALHDSPGEQRKAIQYMLGGWLSLAEQAHRRIYGGDYTVLHGTAPRWQPPRTCADDLLADPLGWMDAEHTNLTAAVEHAAREGMDEVCWDLATTLVTLFEGRGYFDLWESTHQQALNAVRAAENLRGQAAVLSSLGSLYLSRHQHGESVVALREALRIFTELDEPQGLALCRRDLALLERFRGHDDEALVLYAQSLSDFDRAGDVVGHAIVLTQRAHIWMRRGANDTARSHLDEALEIYRSVGYEGGQARALRRAGQVLLQGGEYEAARQSFSDVLDVCRRNGDVIGESHLLRDLGQSFAASGRSDQALGCYERAVALHESVLDHGGAAVARLDMARLLLRTGEPVRSRPLLEAAALMFRDRNMTAELREAESLMAGAVRP